MAITSVLIVSAFFCSYVLMVLGGGRRTVPPGYPPGLIQQTEEEQQFLAYHKCRDGGEAYAAAYLTTREHIVEHNSNYSLGWVNCEMASFIMMSPAKDMNKEKDGQILQTLDVLDLSVIHLSAYERSNRKHAHALKSARAHAIKNPNIQSRDRSWAGHTNGEIDTTIEPVINATRILQAEFLDQSKTGAKPRFDHETIDFLNRTVVVMPFLGTDMGAGHSDLSNRYRYLHTCFWSVRNYFPYVAVSVKSLTDFNYIRSSGLPVFDVLLNEGLPKSASLPVATVQHTRRKLMSGEWQFDFVYYTESDQIVLMRHISDMYRHLLTRPRRMFIPHRLMPYPPQVLSVAFHREPTPWTQLPAFTESINGWEGLHCCIPRQNCVHRKEWVPLANETVVIATLYGLQVPLGNANFLMEKYRACVHIPDKDLYPDPAVKDSSRRYCP